LRRIAGAGIDVFETEPIVNPEFFDLDNVLLTPHSAAQSPEASANARLWSAKNIVDAFVGSPRNVINPAALGRRA
jgi:phosphoglycerate dehydrogenase-like enzyme